MLYSLGLCDRLQTITENPAFNNGMYLDYEEGVKTLMRVYSPSQWTSEYTHVDTTSTATVFGDHPRTTCAYTHADTACHFSEHEKTPMRP